MSISLNDLSGNNNETTSGLKKVDISDIPTMKSEDPNANATPSFVEEQFGALDALVASSQQKRAQYIEDHMDETVAANLDDFDPNEDLGPIAPSGDSESSTTNTISDINNIAKDVQNVDITESNKVLVDTEDDEEKEIKMSEAKEEKEFNNIFVDDDEDKELLEILNDTEPDDDADDDNTDEVSEEKKKEIIDNFRNDVTNLFAKHNAVDTEGFTVSNKAISIQKLFNVKEPDKKIADWVLPTSKKPFSMVEFSGIELQKINPNNSSRNTINTKKENYRTIYNHIQGVTKDGFEAWLKNTPYSDLTQLYFGAYKATFGDLNVVTYECQDPSCNNVFILEQPVDSMYEIDDDFKEEFDKIYNGDTSSPINFNEEIIPVSPKFAIGWIEPTIYSVEIEPLLIDNETRDKYARIIGLLPFIKTMYYIDAENKKYVPIDESPVPKDAAKTVKHKLAVYYNILNSLSNDQLSIPQLKIYNYQTREDHIKFINPECNCPKCGKIIPKEETNAVTLLFNRAQSPLVGN